MKYILSQFYLSKYINNDLTSNMSYLSSKSGLVVCIPPRDAHTREVGPSASALSLSSSLRWPSVGCGGVHPSAGCAHTRGRAQCFGAVPLLVTPLALRGRWWCASLRRMRTHVGPGPALRRCPSPRHSVGLSVGCGGVHPSTGCV